MIHIAVAEDDAQFRNTIRKYLERYSHENCVEIEADYYEDGKQLVFCYEQNYDILLLDIEMPKMNGMDAARKIRETDEHVIIIFITNMAQYAINGYEVGALDYVLKPIKYFSFSLKITKAISSVRKVEQAYLVLPYESGIKKVLVEDVIYAEIRDHWLTLFTKTGEYRMLETMKAFQKKMEGRHFVFCGNGCCVNLKYVTAFAKDKVVLCEKYEISVSRSRKNEVKQELLNYYKEGLR